MWKIQRKSWEFSDKKLKEVWWCYIEDSNNFIKEIKHLKNIPDNALLVTANIVVLYTSTKAINKREEKNISSEDLIKMAELVLKNIYFELKGQVKYQVQLLALNLHLLMLVSSWMS